MSNFKKRLCVSLLAFPLIYILLSQKVLSNLLILIVFLFCIYEWVKIFKKKNAIFFFGLIILFVFLLWQLSYAELFFIEKNWPDFNFLDLKKIVNKFRGIKRRFGGLDE